MGAYVIDTNVLIAANCDADHISDKDSWECQEFLESLYFQSSKIICLDLEGRIFDEYFHHVSRSGQPGFGSLFAKWLWDNQGNASICEQIQINPCEENGHFEGFIFPDSLKSFDLSDRKFVVVVKKSINNPIIYNGTDKDWYENKVALNEFGIQIEFLCSDELQKWENE